MQEYGFCRVGYFNSCQNGTNVAMFLDYAEKRYLSEVMRRSSLYKDWLFGFLTTAAELATWEGWIILTSSRKQ